MTTPERSIEEIVERLANACFNAGFTSGADEYRTARGGAYFKDTKAYKKMKETIQILQAERQKQEEVVEEAKQVEAYEWFDTWYEKTIDPATGMFGKWACERLQEINCEVPRQDIIQALTQPNNK